MKKAQTIIQRIFVIGLVLCAVMHAFAQTADSTSAASGIVSLTLPDWVKYLAWGLIGLYEFIVRRFPTTKNYSITSFIMKVWQFIAPNNNATNPTKPHLVWIGLVCMLTAIAKPAQAQFEYFRHPLPTWPGAKQYKPTNNYAHTVAVGLPSIATGKYNGFVLSGPDVIIAVPTFSIYTGIGVDYVMAVADSLSGKWSKNFTIGPRLYGGANMPIPGSVKAAGAIGVRVTFFDQLLAVGLLYDFTLRKAQTGVGNPAALFPTTN